MTSANDRARKGLPPDRGRGPGDQTAASRMTARVPTARPEETLAEVESRVEKDVERYDTIDYIYVIDGAGALSGVLSMKDLFRHPPTTRAGDVCKKTTLISVLEDADQEEVAAMSLEHGLKSVPVIDGAGRFLGIVPHDTITAVVHEELSEDILRLGGVRAGRPAASDVMAAPILRSVANRAPWLIFGAAGGMVASRVVDGYAATLSRNLALAAFIPLVVYVADAVGTQLEAFVIRDFALRRRLDVARYLLRQSAIVAVTAAILAVASAAMTAVIERDLVLTLVIGAAIFAACLSALISGLIIPLLFRRLGYDPANASGPIGTIIQDIISVFIYFAVASSLL